MDSDRTQTLNMTLRHSWSKVLQRMRLFRKSDPRKSRDVAIVNDEEGRPIKWIKMSRGFSLIEVLVVFVVLGALSATAIFVAGKYQRQAIGSEAMVMMKQLLDGEIMYFIDNDSYFPKDENILLTPNGQESIRVRVAEALKLKVPRRGYMDFTIGATETECVITIRYMIKDSVPCSITGHLNESGESLIIGG